MVSAAAATASPELTGRPCPDVMVIAARGSGEPPQANSQPDWTDPSAYTGDSNKGAGVPLHETYQSLVAANPDLHFSLYPVIYPAAPVSELISNPQDYLQGPQLGASTAMEDINQTERFCGGGVKYLLLGYSSGAWVIHRLLHLMPSNLFGKVVGVGMYGDPLFAPGLAIDRDYRLSDTKFGIAWATDPGNRSVPKSLGSVTYDACLPNDPVCQAPNAETVKQCMDNDSACPHTRYVTDGVTELVADFLDQGLPARSVWPTITSAKAPNGLVGTPYSWTPTVKPTARTSYTWSEDGTLPPGLKPSGTTGGLAGTPTKAGIYDFSVTATSVQQRTASQNEEVVINSGGALAISPASLPGATVGTPYKVTFKGSGGYLPYTWHASGDALSHGLQFTAIQADTTTATLSGAPDQAGTFSLSVTLTDSKGGTTTQSYSLTVASAPTSSGTDDWAQAGYDAAMSYDNTSEQTLGTGNVAQLATFWSQNSNGTSPLPTHSLESGGQVYTTEWGPDPVTGHDNEWLVGRSLADGSVKTSLSLGLASGSCALWAIYNGTAIIRLETLGIAGTKSFSLEAIRLSDGSQVWNRPNWTENGWVVLDGNKLIASADGWFGVLNADTGAEVWSAPYPFRSPGIFAVSHGIIVTMVRVSDPTYTWIPQLEGLSETDGHTIWTDDPIHVPADYLEISATGNTFFVGNPQTDAIEAHDMNTGVLKWQTNSFPNTNVGDEHFTGGIATDGTTIYTPTLISTIDSNGTAHNTSTIRAYSGGAEQWHTQLPGDLAVYSTVLANGVLYFNGWDNSASTVTTFAMSAASGQVLWTSRAEPANTMEQAYVAAGHVISGITVYGVG